MRPMIDDPKFIKLGPDLRSGLIMTWCVAAASEGRLPPIEDLAIKFRMPEARQCCLSSVEPMKIPDFENHCSENADRGCRGGGRLEIRGGHPKLACDWPILRQQPHLLDLDQEPILNTISLLLVRNAARRHPLSFGVRLESGRSQARALGGTGADTRHAPA
jgi:hypothetical protein